MGQLEQLSAVAETLTLRLLELEERLASHEQSLVQGAAGDGGVKALDLQLVNTEERLGRLEGLLNDRDSAFDLSTLAPAEPSDALIPAQEEDGGSELQAAEASQEAAGASQEWPEHEHEQDQEQEQNFLEELALG